MRTPTDPARPHRHHPVLRAALWMLGALLSFASMAVAARELAGEFSTFQILAFRSAIGLLLASLLLSRSGWGQVSLGNFRLHLLRNLTHYVGQFGWFYAIGFIPLAAVFAIEFTVPLWTLLFAALLLGEKITRYRVLAMLMGVAGALLILRPGTEALHPAALWVLAGAFAYGISHTLTRKLAGRESALSILFFMMLLQLPLGLVPALFEWVTPSARHWPWLLLVGVTGLSAHYCMVRALALADAAVVVPLDFLRLPLIALIGFAFYGERVEIWLALGAGLIVIGNLINLWKERRPGGGQG